MTGLRSHTTLLAQESGVKTETGRGAFELMEPMGREPDGTERIRLMATAFFSIARISSGTRRGSRKKERLWFRKGK